MSRYSYAGEFVNPVGTWRVTTRPPVEGESESAPEGVVYYVEVFRSEEKEVDGVLGTFTYWSPHTSNNVFETHEDASEWMEALEESYEEDYDDYLEENRHEIHRMELYEQWRNEY